ncbi:GntR family transcriptional regulator [Leifsonia sp. NPDC056665]|uniref:GntR family transcriptional regulator n=1 Tax=Leifsonia sp. NPDC056665 TaxID=3345901 RepID=UPI0036738822
MLVRLDRASPIGLAEQIADSIRTDIRDGVLSAGEKLPAARELADGLGVNIHTVLRAYSILSVARLIEVRRGQGARVLPAPAPLPSDVSRAVDALVRGAAGRGVSRQQLVRYLEELL